MSDIFDVVLPDANTPFAGAADFNLPNLIQPFSIGIPPPPRSFTVTQDDTAKTMVFQISDQYILRFAPITEYKFWFLPIQVIGTSLAAHPENSQSAFHQATLINSIPAVTQPGGFGKPATTRLTMRDATYYNTDGWFFASSMDSQGSGSYGTLPLRAPIGRGGTANAPPANAVTNQVATLNDVTIYGRTIVRVDTSATVPVDFAPNLFAGYQMYLDNYHNDGVGVLREGPLISKGTQVAGSTMTGSFYLFPDSPPVHTVKMYFVRIGPVGHRPAVPTTEPSVTFANGIA